MKNNYPIKYAIMGIYDGDYKVIYNVVSKCYVIEEIKRYLQDGSLDTRVEVVFPFKENNGNYSWTLTEPSYGIRSKCCNSMYVEKVYDDYNEALKDADAKNEELFYNEVGDLKFDSSFDARFEQIKIEHDQKSSYYQRLQEMIEANTQELVLNSKIKNQSVIIDFKDKYKINGSLYHFLDLYSTDPFVVYNISEEDFNFMIKQIKDDQKINEEVDITPKILLQNDPEKGIIIFNSEDGSEPGTFYLKKQKLYYDENKIKFSKQTDVLKVYTTETYDDVIGSYLINFVDREPLPKGEIRKRILGRKINLKE